jgi:17beta-estradiol 17-dehydrogenase / very-long-chain 3-oxoacyl-CoA reductase
MINILLTIRYWFKHPIFFVLCFFDQSRVFLMQVPLYVATKMASIRRSSFWVPSSDGYARAGLRAIGYEPRCTPYWPHSLLWGLIQLLPESIVDFWRLSFCLAIRKKGHLKDSRKME